MSEPKSQFKVLVSPETEAKLTAQAAALGFHSENGIAAVYVSALAGVPAHKVFEALAKVRAYHEKADFKKGTEK